jgi:hypothetical protein|nr:MAG TPA: hypothetical protein [Caudoviricetes sp.]
MAKEKQGQPEVTPAPTTEQEPAFLAQYRVAYPECLKFHVTGDNLVFLSHEYDKAVSHQKTVGKGELKTY